MLFFPTTVFLFATAATTVLSAPRHIKPFPPNPFRPPYWPYTHHDGETGEVSAEIPPPGEPEKAQVFVCEHWGWRGKCENMYSPLGSGPDACKPLDGTASSIGPFYYLSCTFYKNADCRSFAPNDKITLEYPGNDNLVNTAVGNMNDVLRSYNCIYNPNATGPAS